MKRFIYVFCVEARDSLLSRGFHLIQEDLKQKIFIFENKDGVPFPNEDYAFVLTDTLTL